MTTSKRRVCGYLEPNAEEAFDAFCSQHKVGVSAALNLIISGYFRLEDNKIAKIVKSNLEEEDE